MGATRFPTRWMKRHWRPGSTQSPPRASDPPARSPHWLPEPVPLAGAPVCHAAHAGEGPVLAILAMLALKGRAARGSGRLRSSLPLRYAPWHRMLQAGTGKQALQPNQKAGLKWLIPAARGTFLSWRTRGHFYFALTPPCVSVRVGAEELEEFMSGW